MLKRLQFLIFILLSSGFAFGQTIISDYETPETTNTFQLFDNNGPLEGVITEVLENPAPDAVNGSSMVTKYEKLTTSPGWGGGFSDPQTIVDLTSDNQVCVKVHMPAIGNVALKLEMSSTGGDDWERAIENTVVNGWEEICFDMTLPSSAAPNTPAFGHTYNRVVIFFDFFLTLPEDRTYYLDDIITQQGVSITEGDVTFTVDMSDYTGSFTTPYIFGTFNGWTPDEIALNDNGDGTWSVTLPDLAIGSYEYKFLVDGNPDTQESLNRWSPCTVTFDDGAGGVFTNRALSVAGDATVDPVCFNSCYACGDAVNITFDLGTSNIVVAGEGVYIAGGGNFGVPGDFPLTDGGNNIHSITIERQKGFSSFYTFTNGACGDFSCKEDISGQDCANPDNFNDRFLPSVTQDTTVATCFEVCTTTADDCGSSNAAEVTFQVDMSGYVGTVDQVELRGTLANWDPGIAMTDIGNDRWETTVTLAEGSYEYKFHIVEGDVWEEFSADDPCTITTPDGLFTNRLIEVSGEETVCFFWNSCDNCVTNTRDFEIDHTFFQLQPNITSDVTNIIFEADNIENKTIRIFDVVGNLVQEVSTQATQQQIATTDFANGVYIVTVQMGDTIGTQKLIKQ